MSAALSQATFARLMDVHRAQVTRWIARGMPTMGDGRIDPEVGADWVERNIDPGVRYAARQARERRAPVWDRPMTPIEACDALVRMAVYVTANFCPLVTAESARDAGLPPKLATQVKAIAAQHVPEVADAILRHRFGIPEPPDGGPRGEGYTPAGDFWRKIEAALPDYSRRKAA